MDFIFDVVFGARPCVRHANCKTIATNEMKTYTKQKSETRVPTLVHDMHMIENNDININA